MAMEAMVSLITPCQLGVFFQFYSDQPRYPASLNCPIGKTTYIVSNHADDLVVEWILWPTGKRTTREQSK